MKCRSAVAEIGLRRPSVRPPLGWIETGGQTGQRGLIHNLHILHLGLDRVVYQNVGDFELWFLTRHFESEWYLFLVKGCKDSWVLGIRIDPALPKPGGWSNIEWKHACCEKKKAETFLPAFAWLFYLALPTYCLVGFASTIPRLCRSWRHTDGRWVQQFKLIRTENIPSSPSLPRFPLFWSVRDFKRLAVISFRPRNPLWGRRSHEYLQASGPGRLLFW